MIATAPGAARERAAHLGPERRRPQVLDAALAITATSGVAAVTIGSVAERLGVTRPVVYSCFADPVELIKALVNRERDLMLEGLLEALHTARGDYPQAAFVDGFSALLSVVEARPDTWRLIFAANPDSAVAEMIATARETLAAGSTRWIGPAMETWWATADLDRKAARAHRAVSVVQRSRGPIPAGPRK